MSESNLRQQATEERADKTENPKEFVSLSFTASSRSDTGQSASLGLAPCASVTSISQENSL